jgi:hypothetical protein
MPVITGSLFFFLDPLLNLLFLFIYLFIWDQLYSPAGLDLEILLPQLPKCKDNRHPARPHSLFLLLHNCNSIKQCFWFIVCLPPGLTEEDTPMLSAIAALAFHTVSCSGSCKGWNRMKGWMNDDRHASKCGWLSLEVQTQKELEPPSTRNQAVSRLFQVYFPVSATVRT